MQKPFLFWKKEYSRLKWRNWSPARLTQRPCQVVTSILINISCYFLFVLVVSARIYLDNIANSQAVNEIYKQCKNIFIFHIWGKYFYAFMFVKYAYMMLKICLLFRISLQNMQKRAFKNFNF